MSAINPASFVTPTAGLQPPGVGHIGYAQEPSTDRRHPHENRNYGISPLSQAPPNLREALERGEFSDGKGIRNTYIDPYQGLGSGPRQHDAAFGHGSPSHDPFSPIPSSGYGFLDPVGSDYLRAASNQRTEHPQADWVGGFQGLSLNS